MRCFLAVGIRISGPLHQDGYCESWKKSSQLSLTEPLSIIYQPPWLMKEVTKDWRLANITPTYKKGWKEDRGNYRPVSLTSVSGEVMKQIIWSIIIRQV